MFENRLLTEVEKPMNECGVVALRPILESERCTDPVGCVNWMIEGLID